MASKPSCKIVNGANSAIQRKVHAAFTDIKKGRPKAAGIKLHQAAFMIGESLKKIWSPKKELTLGNETFWVGSQLMRPSTMHWPKWKDRVKILVDNVDAEVKRTSCK
jgi:hypothetical protein